MSGCVNCVWDRYGEEVEEWAAKRREADEALAGRRGEERVAEEGEGEGLERELLSGVPVGILEFMKQEKRLKEKHLREGTKGG